MDESVQNCLLEGIHVLLRMSEAFVSLFVVMEHPFLALTAVILEEMRM